MSLGLSVASMAMAKVSEAELGAVTERERAWLAAGHRVRARVADYPPYMLNAQPPSGLALDYLDHIAARFGFAVDYVFTAAPFSEAVADVAGERRMYDLLPTFTRTPERETQFAITADYLSAPWVIFARSDSPYILGLEGLAGKTLVAEQGFLIAQKIRRDFPRIRILGVPTSLDALMTLATGQADAYVGNLAVGTFMVKENRLSNLMVVAPTPYGLNTQAMAVRADWPELASLISKGIASMTREDHNAILQKWLTLEMRPRTDYRLFAAALVVILAVFHWNRRLAREIKTRERAESRLRKSEADLRQETVSLQRMQTELQHKKAALQDLNATLESRLRVAVEERTRSLREAAVQAQESNAAKSAFLSMVSHELRAPLHDILGYARLVARQIPPQARDHLAIIQDSGAQLLRLINEILDYSRGEAKPILLEPTPVSLPRLARQLAAIYRPLAERNQSQLLVRLDTGGLDWILADEQRLTQILRNLLDNACKFTEKGRIELAIELAAPLEPDAAAGLAGGDCLIGFCVSDTGLGIPESQQGMIFQPFQRLERHRGLPGIGLGLAIARQLVTAMGGRIALRSHQGESSGTALSFQLRLPIGDGTEAVSDEEPPIAGYRGRRRTLLIADDQAHSRRFLADACRHWGFRVLLASDGAEALRSLHAAEPPVDAVLIDQFMPRLDGWGFLAEFRSTGKNPGVPVILISAAPAQRPGAFPEGIDFDRFVMKPVSEADLGRLLAEVLDIEWEYGQGLSDEKDAPEPDTAALAVQLSAQERERLRDMLAIGQVLEVQRWAREMAETDPRREILWQRLIQLAGRLDLPALKQLT